MLTEIFFILKIFVVQTSILFASLPIKQRSVIFLRSSLHSGFLPLEEGVPSRYRQNPPKLIFNFKDLG